MTTHRDDGQCHEACWRRAVKESDIATAHWMRSQGSSLFEIAQHLGRTKEWLRSHGIS